MEEEDMRSGPETNHKNKSLLLRINVTGHRMVHVVWYGVKFCLYQTSIMSSKDWETNKTCQLQ